MPQAPPIGQTQAELVVAARRRQAEAQNQPVRRMGKRQATGNPKNSTTAAKGANTGIAEQLVYTTAR